MQRCVGVARAGYVSAVEQPHVVRWGTQSSLAIDNFPISGEPMPIEIVRAIAMVKSEAAKVNLRAGVIEATVADGIVAACEEIIDGLMDDQFPVDVFQTGSGTSTNMNVNEVVAHRASELVGRPVHPNDHVNASQSSNDVVPTAVRLAVGLGLVRDVVPALRRLHESLLALAADHASTVKLGRTHLMDAAPITFGQEAGGWARMVELGVDRLAAVMVRVCELPLGGTAVGTGLNAPESFGADVAAALARRTGIEWVEAINHFEAQSSHDALVDASAGCRSVALSLHKIAGDLRLLGSGPRGGLGELELPALQAGSSIMPGKVNPVIPEVVQQVAAQLVGNDAAVAFAISASTLQLSTAIPVIGRNVMQSVTLLASAARVLDEKCIRGVVVDTQRMLALAERSASISMILVPRIGYDAATRVAKAMLQRDLSLSAALAAEGFGADVQVDLLALTRAGEPSSG